MERRNPFCLFIPEVEVVLGVMMLEQLQLIGYPSRKADYASDCPEMVLKDVVLRIRPILF